MDDDDFVQMKIWAQLYLHCVQKKTPTNIFLHNSMNYLWICEYTQRSIDSDNVKIRYSLRPMT